MRVPERARNSRDQPLRNVGYGGNVSSWTRPSLTCPGPRRCLTGRCAHARTGVADRRPVVREGGSRAVFAFPLQVGAARLGVMDVFQRRPGPLTETQLRTALVLADVTVETLLDRQEDSRRRGSADGLVLDVGNRAQLFQA